METILATFLVCLISLALLQLLPSSALAVKRAEARLQSNAIASTAMEAQLARGFRAQQVGQTLVWPDQLHDGIVYHVSLEIFLPPEARAEHLRGVRCRVEWEFAGREYQFVREAVLSAVRGG